MNIGSKIKERRKELNVSAEKLAKKLGVSKTTIYRYEKGEIAKMPTETLEKIAIALNTTPAYFMGWETLNSSTTNNKNEIEHSLISNIFSEKTEISIIYGNLEKTRQKKVLEFAKGQLEEQNNPKGTVTSIFDKLRAEEKNSERTTDYVEGLVSAGQGVFQDDNLHMEVSLRVDDIPEKDKYDTIAKVVGDSMEPMIKDNDLLFIKVTSQVDVNKIGIFQVNNQNFVKKLKRDYDGSWYLQSLNNNYSEIYLTEDDSIRTIGEVVDIYRED